MTIKEAYLLGRAHLAASGSEEAAIEAEVLLRRALGLDRAQLYARWEGPMPETSWDRYRVWLDERAGGRPVHYIVGEREFMGLSFTVDERVLIPRPETEILVELAVSRLRGRDQPLVADIGSGSGCIAVSVAHLLPSAMVYATDRSADALAVAAANAARHHMSERVTVLRGDLLNALPPAIHGRVDAVLSNPPYIPESQVAGLPREIREFEPREAILGPGDGMDAHRHLAAGAPRWLAPGGFLAVEVAAGQSDAVRGIFHESGVYDRIGVERDRAGLGRVVWGTVEK
ncbi:MAG TPA: peptide chain release factor N(5)-glutamine methyltransferase [bacterium]